MKKGREAGEVANLKKPPRKCDELRAAQGTKEWGGRYSRSSSSEVKDSKRLFGKTRHKKAREVRTSYVRRGVETRTAGRANHPRPSAPCRMGIPLSQSHGAYLHVERLKGMSAERMQSFFWESGGFDERVHTLGYEGVRKSSGKSRRTHNEGHMGRLAQVGLMD